MYNKKQHKDKPPDYLWWCVECGVLYGNHDYDSDHGRMWEQVWSNGSIRTKYPYYTQYHTIGGTFNHRNSPPEWAVRMEHKKNRAHVSRKLHDLKGSLDWDAVEDFEEPCDIVGRNSAWWNWW